jgi:hypothetical protein
MMVELKIPFGKVTKSLCQRERLVNEPWKPNTLEGASILKEPGASSAWRVPEVMRSDEVVSPQGG